MRGLPATPTLWEEGAQPGRELIALGAALTLTFACLDLLFGSRLGVFFDAGLLLVSLVLALSAHPQDFFTAGVLPPLLALGTLTLLALTRPEAIDAGPGAGFGGTLISGLGRHGIAVVLAYVGCLAVLAVRRRVRTLRGGEPPLSRSVRDRRLPV